MFSLGASERYLYFCSVSAVNSTPSPGKRGGRTYPSSIVGGSETGHRSIRSRSGPMEGSPDACLWVNSQAGRRSPSPVDPAHRCPGCGHRPRSLRRSSVGVRLSQGHDLLLLLLSASTERRKDRSISGEAIHAKLGCCCITDHDLSAFRLRRDRRQAYGPRDAPLITE